MNTLSLQCPTPFLAFVAAQYELYLINTDPRWDTLDGLWETAE